MSPPIQAIVIIVTWLISRIGRTRINMYTPATTIVAACRSEETGVGPSIESGNQT